MQNDGNKTKAQLISELEEMRQRIAKLEAVKFEPDTPGDALSVMGYGYHSIADSLSDAIIIIDEEANIVSWSKVAETIFGYTKEEILNKHLSILMPKQHRRVFRKAMDWMNPRRVIPDNGITYELPGLKKDGSQLLAEISLGCWKHGGKSYYVSSVRDITRSKEAEGILRESEEKYRTLFELSPSGIITLDMKGVIQSCNKAVYEKGGYSENELVGKHFTKIAPVQARDIPKFLKMFTSIIGGKTPEPFEVEFTHKDGTKGWAEIRVSLLKANDTKTGVQAILSDITERKLMENRLQKSEQELAAIVKTSSSAIKVIDSDFNVVRVNPAMETFSGLSSEESVGRKCYEIAQSTKKCHTEDCLLAQTMKTKEVMSNETVLKKKDGTEVTCILTVSPLLNDSGEVTGILEDFIDITERKQAEEALRESETFRSSLLNNSPNPINVINPDTSIRYVNPALEKLTGYSAEELIGKKAPFPFWRKESLEQATPKLIEDMHHGIIEYEVEFQKKNGEKFRVAITNAPAKTNGKLNYLLSSWVDITERKQTEESLRENEAFRSRLLNISPDPIFVVNPDTSIRYVNPALEKLTGFPSSELIGTKSPYPWWRKKTAQIVQTKLEEGMRFERRGEEVLFQKKNGEKFRIETSSTPVIIDDELQYTLISWNDITERKRAEEEIRLRAQLLDNVGDSITLHDFIGNLLYVNETFCKSHGYKQEELIGMNLRRLDIPEYWVFIEAKLEELRQKGEVVYESSYLHKDSSRMDVEVHARVIESGGRKLVLNDERDITERKQAEEELRLRAQLLNNASDAISLLDFDGNIVYVNEMFCQSHGYSREELIGMNIRQLDIQLSGKRLESIEKELEEKGVAVFEATHTRKDGSTIEVEVHSRTIYSGGSQFNLSVERDITERLKREEEIKKLSAAIEYSPSIVIITDKDAVIEYANRKFIELTGYNAGEVIGKNAWDIDLLPAKEQEEIWNNLFNGKDWYGEFINRKKNGELYYEAASISAIKGEDGNIVHFVKVATDITEKKQTEGELQQSEKQLRELTGHMRRIREEERKSIARNIHDNLGQALTALKLDMSWLSKKLTEEQSPLISRTNEMSQLIDQSIQTVKTLSSELRPGMLDILGLAAAAEWHTGEFQKRTGIKCRLNLGEDDIKLEEEHTIDCFRILQEALTNVSLHAEATRVGIRLKQKDGKMVMQIKDNGKGITGRQLSSSRSFGLIGMQERAKSIGGELEIKSAPDKGTAVKLTVPTK